MTKERIAELRQYLKTFDPGFALRAMEECLNEIERLQKELAKANRLPDSMQEAFNSADGTYRP